MNDAHETVKLQFHGHHSYFRKDFQMLLTLQSLVSLISQKRFPDAASSYHRPCKASTIGKIKAQKIVSKIPKIDD